jgi:hypothetical protein
VNRCSLGRAAARYSVFASLLAVSSTITVLGSSLHTVQGSVDDCEWDAQTPRARGGDSAANPPTVEASRARLNECPPRYERPSHRYGTLRHVTSGSALATGAAVCLAVGLRLPDDGSPPGRSNALHRGAKIGRVRWGEVTSPGRQATQRPFNGLRPLDHGHLARLGRLLLDRDPGHDSKGPRGQGPCANRPP